MLTDEELKAIEKTIGYAEFVQPGLAINEAAKALLSEVKRLRSERQQLFDHHPICTGCDICRAAGLKVTQVFE